MKNRAELIIENGQLINKVEILENKVIQLECEKTNNCIGAMRDLHVLLKKVDEQRVS